MQETTNHGVDAQPKDINNAEVRLPSDGPTNTSYASLSNAFIVQHTRDPAIANNHVQKWSEVTNKPWRFPKKSTGGNNVNGRY